MVHILHMISKFQSRFGKVVRFFILEFLSYNENFILNQ